MKVHELHRLLGDLLMEGKADYDVYVIPDDTYDFDHLPFETVMTKEHSWEVVGVDWTGWEDAYICLRMGPE